MKDIIAAITKILSEKSITITMMSALGGLICYAVLQDWVYSGIVFFSIFLLVQLIVWLSAKIKKSYSSMQSKKASTRASQAEEARKREIIKCFFDGIAEYKLRNAIDYLKYEKDSPYMICVPHGVQYSDFNICIEYGREQIHLMTIQDQFDSMIVFFDPYFKELLLQYRDAHHPNK